MAALNGFAQFFAWWWEDPLPLLGTDLEAAALISAQGFHLTQPWRPGSVEDLEN
jgi:hypothetical protein